MPDTQEKLLSVEEAQEKIREGSVYTGKVDTDKTPTEQEIEQKRLDDEAEEKRLKEEADLEVQKLAEEKEAEEKAKRESEAEKETEAEKNRKEEEDRLEKERIENERIENERIEAEKESEKFKYKSHEEAEKAAKEAERKMHEATTQAKKLKEEIEAIKEETSQAAKDGKIDKKQEGTLKNVFVDMLKRIDDLDVSDDNYREELAVIWAEGLGEGYSLRDKERDEALKAKREKEESDKSVLNQANTLAKKAGLDMDFITDENGKQISTVDYDLFWATVSKSEIIGKTPEERIDWVINEVKGKRSKDKEAILNQQKILNKKSEESQNKNKVLEKGITVVTDKKLKDVHPLSITEGLSRIERRI